MVHGFRVLSGFAEATAGSALTLGFQGLAGGIGWPIIVHGLDQMVTGMQTAITGVPRNTLTSQLMQRGGVPGGLANFADDTMTMLATMGGGAFVKQSASKNPFMWGRVPFGVGGPITGNRSKQNNWVFPKDPKDLLPNLPRDSKGYIYAADNLRIRPEQHMIKPGEIYNPRHHGLHYHVETRRNPLFSWNSRKNRIKLKPEDYSPGSGTGFLPGEEFPGAL